MGKRGKEWGLQSERRWISSGIDRVSINNPPLYLNVKLEHALSHLRCLVTKGDVSFVLKHIRHNCQSCIWSAKRGCEVKVLDTQPLVTSKFQGREGKILICKRVEQMPSATDFSDTVSTPVSFL